MARTKSSRRAAPLLARYLTERERRRTRAQTVFVSALGALGLGLALLPWFVDL